jgi:hypothetical protein
MGDKAAEFAQEEGGFLLGELSSPGPSWRFQFWVATVGNALG